MDSVSPKEEVRREVVALERKLFELLRVAVRVDIDVLSDPSHIVDPLARTVNRGGLGSNSNTNNININSALPLPASHYSAGLDRLSGAVEWFSLWPSARALLSSALASFDIKFGPMSAVDTVAQSNGSFSVKVVYSGVSGFPGANAIAHSMDEAMRLYKSRIDDLRGISLSSEETALRNALMNPQATFIVDLDAISSLDWEGDKFYNAYTELSPESAASTLGRVTRAISRLMGNSSDYDKSVIQRELRGVLLKVTKKPKPRIKLRRGVLKISERLWEGPHFSEQDIERELKTTLKLGRDFNAIARQLSESVVPIWSERFAAPIKILFETFVPGSCPDPPSGLSTLVAADSSACFERVLSAFSECCETFPLGKERIAESLAGIAVSRGNNKRCFLEEIKAASNAIGTGRFVLVLECPWEKGRDAAPRIEEIKEALRIGLSLRSPPSGLEGFHVNGITQTPQSVEIEGNIGSVHAFTTVFDIMTGYTVRSLAVTK